MAVPLRSSQFSNVKLLQDCATRPSAHLIIGTVGAHVRILQDALIQLDLHKVLLDIPPLPRKLPRAEFLEEFSAGRYGIRTAEIVKAYKSLPPKPILGPGQVKPDSIVGQMTIDALDEDMAELEGKPAPTPKLDKPRDLLIFLSGVQTPGGGELDDSTPDTSAFLMRKPMQSIARGRFNAAFIAIGGALMEGEMDTGLQKIMQFIRSKESKPAGKLVIYGYSAGGNNSLELCRRLDALNLVRKQMGEPMRTVDLLVTVDAATRSDKPLGISRTVAGCVTLNRNYFQTTPSPAPGSGAHGGPNSALSSMTTPKPAIINNMDLTSELSTFVKETKHNQVEKASLDRAKADIQAALR